MPTTFLSPNKGLRIWGEQGKWNVKFEMGRFTTSDENVISKLKNHNLYGKKFAEIGKRKITQASNIIQDVRTAGTQPVLDKEEKLMRLGRLEAKLLKNDGTFRKDASPENREEYNSLKQELGV